MTTKAAAGVVVVLEITIQIYKKAKRTHVVYLINVCNKYKQTNERK
jgi:hypothetical protein